MREGLCDAFLRLGWDMAMEMLLLRHHLGRALLVLGRVDAAGLAVLVALGATALDVLEVGEIDDVADLDALFGKRVQHLEEEALDRGWVD